MKFINAIPMKIVETLMVVVEVSFANNPGYDFCSRLLFHFFLVGLPSQQARHEQLRNQEKWSVACAEFRNQWRTIRMENINNDYVIGARIHLYTLFIVAI